MDLRDIGEFGLIDRIRRRTKSSHRAVLKGLGDDAAAIDMGEKVLLVTTDLLIEDIHFKLAWTDPFHLGRKAIFVNLSDIAAMGGTPKYFLISLGVPGTLPLSFLTSLYRGLRSGARRFGVDLIGGDTSLSKRMVINICLLGEAEREGLLFRNGAKVGDHLFVSGTLGDAALGLKVLQRKGHDLKARGLIQKHLSPLPRVELGGAIAKHRLATAMIDVSDGLLIDTSHLLEESRVGARIWEERLPLSKLYRKWIGLFSKSPYELALSGGEDYELLFTAPPGLRKRILDLSLSLKIPITEIGEIVPERKGLRLVRSDGKEFRPFRLGFEHFRGSGKRG